MDTERPLKMQGLESETSGRSEKHGEAMEHEGSPVRKKEKERDKERHHHHHRHHHRGREREKDRAREKKHHHKHSSKEKQRSSERMSTGIVSLSVDQTALPLSPSTDNASDQVQSVRPSAVVDQSHDVQSRLVQQGAEEETEKEPGEISAEEGEITEDGELQVEVFMDVQETEPPVEEKASFLPKKRKHSPATQELEEKHVRSKISVDVLHSSVGDAFHTDEFESQGLHGESRKISRVRKSSNSHKSSRRRKDPQDVKDGYARSRRSRSKERESTKRFKESESVKSLTEVDGLDRKRRSRSQTREKLQIRKDVNITDRKRRSKSRDILPVRKEEDNSDRRRRSKSRESVRERKHDESLDGKLLSKSKGVLRVHNDDEKPTRRRSHSKESLRECKVNDQDLSRHVAAEIQESRREDGSKGQVDSVDRKPRSRSRETLREPRIEGSVDRKVQGERAGRRRRSRSRECLRDRRVEEVFDRKGRSRSRESVRDREGEDREERRTAIRGDDSMNRSRRHEHESGRHGRAEEIPDKVKEGRGHSRADSTERKRRSLSRESLRERRGGSRSRDQANDFHDISIRHGWRANDGRSHFDAQDGRNGNFHNGGRDRPYGSDRHRDRDRGRDGGYGNHQDRDRSDRTYQNRGSRYDSHKDKEETPREEDNEEDYQERIETQLAAQEEDDVERIKEESRRRRQAILEKYKQQHQEKTDVEQPLTVIGDQKSGGPGEVQNGASPSETTGDMHAVDQTPVLISVTLEKGSLLNGSAVAQALPGTGGLGDGSPESEHSADMFCDDIFGESPAGERRVGKVDGLAIDTSGLTDNWDDAEGRYCFRIGEVLDGRYEVLSSHGSGVFSTVVRARDMKAGRYDPDEVAIKIIRNNETMFRTGQQELVILRKLAGADPENRRHCVRLLSSFEYRNHLCLVFESLHMNLREILKKFGRNIGINLTAVRAYAKQLFIALKHLRNCGVLHCDIKPDNMLVNDAKNVLKLCDFGSAMFAGENEITPYLVSRFYRAPEIILGLPYDHALDVWSVGCCLYELYSGKMLFPGHTNNDMLKLQMELKGPFPKKMLKKAKFTDQHFDQDYNFCAVEEDPVTKKMVKRIVVNVKPKDMAVLVASSGTVDEDSRIVGHFKDMLEKIFILDPDKRMTVSQALNHPFISGK